MNGETSIRSFPIFFNLRELQEMERKLIFFNN